MKKLLTILQFPPDENLSRLALSALQAEAALRDIEINLESTGKPSLDEAIKIAKAKNIDSILLIAESTTLSGKQAGLTIVAADRPDVVRHTAKLLDQVAPRVKTKAAPAATPAKESAAAETKFLIGVTSCPTGIAHTFMAAEALLKGAAKMGYTMKVETRGSVGAKNELTPEDIARADAVVVAADAVVETTRFAGKRLLETGTKAAINDAQKLIREALKLEPSAPSGAAAPGQVKKTERKGAYKHLMTGVSHMLPLVVAGGLLIALAFAIGGINAGDNEGTLGWALMQIGGKAAFALFIPIFAGFIAFSIADRPGLTPGLIGGMLAASVGAGFLGGIAAGFLAGYFTKWLNSVLKLPDQLQGLKPVLLLPLISSLVIGLSMIYLIGPPVKMIMDGMSTWLNNMQNSSALVLGLILGAMMAFDMGGPINKAAYTFSVGLVSTQIYGPMAAVMAAGMTPPLAAALAATLFKSRFTKDEQQATKATAVLGAAFITEGAIPYAAADPLRVIPSMLIGSATAGAISMYFGCKLMVPHGGMFVLAIPNAITNGLSYLIAIVAGTAVSTMMLYVLKKPKAENIQ